MRLWFAHSSEVPIYRQLVTQVSLAILSGDLQPGQRLPSTRELARRFGLHPNTVSAGYRQLEKEGWTERRRGSGITIRANIDIPGTAEQKIDHHIAGFFRAAREMGLPADAVRARVARWLEAPAPERFVLIDGDEELRRILLSELRAITKWEVRDSTLRECARSEVLLGALPLCRPSQAKAVRAALPKGIELVTLPIQSPQAWLGTWLEKPQEQLVGVVSHWPGFLEAAQTMLVAAGFAPESLLVRDAREPRWRRGLEQVAAILCDSYTANRADLPTKPVRLVYPLLAETAQALLCEYTQEKSSLV